MKMNKYISMMFLALTASYTFTACSDDDTSLGEAPRLFSPVATVTAESNTLTADWNNIAGATNYNLELYRVSGTDAETGESIYEPYTTASCEGAPYTFTNLNWDEKYMLKISCDANGEKKSNVYETSEVTINYLSKISGTKSIDQAVRINWADGGEKVSFVQVLNPESREVLKTVAVSSAEYAQGFKDVYGLEAETPYLFYLYGAESEEAIGNSNYAGRVNATTAAAVDYDTQFGAGNWIDMRSWDDEEAADTLTTAGFKELIQEGMAFILKGGMEYKVSGLELDKSVTFCAGATLGESPRLVINSAMKAKKGSSISKLEFIGLDIYSDKSNEEGYVANNTDKGFGGRQVFNINGTGATITDLKFKDCHIEGFRSVVRAQAATDNINNVHFDGCSINGIGDQAVVTTNNKKGDMKNITFKDCTITNIVYLGDLRSTAGALTVNIENCTFCYAPIETNANANTPLLRFGSNAATVNISKSFFGPSLATEGSAGSKVKTYTAGTFGSIMTDGSKAAINVDHSFKTNYKWADIAGKTYPFEGLNELSMDEKALWQNPSEGDFKVVGAVGEEGIGASKWQ